LKKVWIPIISPSCTILINNYLASDYEKGKVVIAEISSLSQRILDARLALTRSKQRHPEPRLTVSSASAQLDSQIVKMQEAADELQGENSKVSAIKEAVKAKSRQLEAARSRRAELEKIRSSKVDEVEDPRYAGLYDWFVRSLSPSVIVKTHSW
jgi:chromosome segregation ATPase